MQEIGVNYLPMVPRMVGGRAPGMVVIGYVRGYVITDKRFSE